MNKILFAVIVAGFVAATMADDTCRTVSYGKRELVPGEGYQYVLKLNNGSYDPEVDSGRTVDLWNSIDWIKYSELGAGIPGKPCVFPFIVNGVKFNECTSYQSPNGWPRCATKKNQDLTRVRLPAWEGADEDMIDFSYKGSWGFCGKQCPVEKESCLTISGDGVSVGVSDSDTNADSYEMCEFPFEYNGVVYNECSWDWQPQFEESDKRNADLNDILDFDFYDRPIKNLEDKQFFQSPDETTYKKPVGAWCKWKNGDHYGRGKCGPNCPIPKRPATEGACFAKDKNGMQKSCNFSLYKRKHDGCVDANFTQLQNIQQDALQHMQELDAEIFEENFPNESNRIWCPIGEEKGEVGLCSPRCPVSNLFIGMKFQLSGAKVCVPEMTFHYKNGEVTNVIKRNICGGATVSGGEVYMEVD